MKFIPPKETENPHYRMETIDKIKVPIFRYIWKTTNKYVPHQGKKETTRRLKNGY